MPYWQPEDKAIYSFLQIRGAMPCQKIGMILVIKAGLKLKLPKLIFPKMCSSIIKKEIRKIRMIFVKENSFSKSNLGAFWRSLKCFVIWLSVPHGTSNFVHPKIILHNHFMLITMQNLRIVICIQNWILLCECGHWGYPILGLPHTDEVKTILWFMTILLKTRDMVLHPFLINHGLVHFNSW